MSYLESVVRNAGSGVAGTASGLVDVSLGDAAPFLPGNSHVGDDSLNLAARRVSEGLEASCMEKYEAAIDVCNRLAKVMGGLAGLALCKQNAFMGYQECRGF